MMHGSRALQCAWGVAGDLPEAVFPQYRYLLSSDLRDPDTTGGKGAAAGISLAQLGTLSPPPQKSHETPVAFGQGESSWPRIHSTFIY